MEIVNSGQSGAIDDGSLIKCLEPLGKLRNGGIAPFVFVLAPAADPTGGRVMGGLKAGGALPDREGDFRADFPRAAI